MYYAYAFYDVIVYFPTVQTIYHCSFYSIIYTYIYQ